MIGKKNKSLIFTFCAYNVESSPSGTQSGGEMVVGRGSDWKSKRLTGFWLVTRLLRAVPRASATVSLFSQQLLRSCQAKRRTMRTGLKNEASNVEHAHPIRRSGATSKGILYSIFGLGFQACCIFSIKRTTELIEWQGCRRYVIEEVSTVYRVASSFHIVCHFMLYLTRSKIGRRYTCFGLWTTPLFIHTKEGLHGRWVRIRSSLGDKVEPLWDLWPMERHVIGRALWRCFVLFVSGTQYDSLAIEVPTAGRALWSIDSREPKRTGIKK